MSSGVLESPRRLTRADDRSEFTSGATELDEWLRSYAWQNQRANNAVTYVTVRGSSVMGYYALAVAAYARDHAPDELRRAPREVPCVLLARLAVDRRVAGLGVGAALLRDAFLRAYQASRSVGAAALLVHCRDDAARSFYLHNGDFLASPVEPKHLFLPMRAIGSLLE
ncbi:MAG TPA: N-acetyltransferase [Micrococcales bacterium]|nr:N-acetyltransferase [Micrococcales bacterium]